jgi:hypothetical protein
MNVIKIISAIYDFFRPFLAIKKSLEEIKSTGKETALSVKRLEILHAIDHHPEERYKIMHLYDEYKLMGGNSYVDDYFKQWVDATKGKNKRTKR